MAKWIEKVGDVPESYVQHLKSMATLDHKKFDFEDKVAYRCAEILYDWERPLGLFRFDEELGSKEQLMGFIRHQFEDAAQKDHKKLYTMEIRWFRRGDHVRNVLAAYVGGFSKGVIELLGDLRLRPDELWQPRLERGAEIAWDTEYQRDGKTERLGQISLVGYPCDGHMTLILAPKEPSLRFLALDVKIDKKTGKKRYSPKVETRSVNKGSWWRKILTEEREYEEERKYDMSPPLPWQDKSTGLDVNKFIAYSPGYEEDTRRPYEPTMLDPARFKSPEEARQARMGARKVAPWEEAEELRPLRIDTIE